MKPLDLLDFVVEELFRLPQRLSLPLLILADSVVAWLSGILFFISCSLFNVSYFIR